MDSDMEKSCLDEISHTVLDSKGKISVRTLSNNYEITFADAVKLLQRWIDANGAKAKLSPEFIVRGIDSKGTPFITVANEKRLKTIKSKAERVSSMLYALEVASESSRKFNIPVDQEFRAISLPLKSDKRDVKVFVPVDKAPAPTVKQEAKPKSIFGAAASSSKVTPKAEPPKVAVKEEKQSPPAAASAVVKKEPTPTKPAASPTKVSPSKKKDAKKPVATGKSSIASFFSNKPAASKPAAPKPVEKPVEVKVKEEKPSPKEEKKKPAKEDETQRWKRMISDESSGDDEVIPNTPQDKKPEKKKGGRKPMTFKKGAAGGKANPSKKSRILQVEDSSEEEEGDRKMKEPEERLVAFEVEESDGDAEMKDVKELSPEKPVENDSSSANRGRAKVKKLVTKTFMDEEGYLTTIKEYQMVSASEDEGEGDSVTATNNNNLEAAVANGKKESVTGKGKSTDKKAPPASKVTPPTPKTKQGSIMSFFAKK